MACAGSVTRVLWLVAAWLVLLVAPTPWLAARVIGVKTLVGSWLGSRREPWVGG